MHQCPKVNVLLQLRPIRISILSRSSPSLSAWLVDFALSTKIKANHNVWSTSANTHDKDKADPPQKVQKSYSSYITSILTIWVNICPNLWTLTKLTTTQNSKRIDQPANCFPKWSPRQPHSTIVQFITGHSVRTPFANMIGWEKKYIW